jgi:hypothetical protein
LSLSLGDFVSVGFGVLGGDELSSAAGAVDIIDF